mmetsp:Transcript_563/g.1443  ORF Transcript_563/g.1443 Transcript_563/m.1443 type:complete len:168 (-) Transcript_563:86-589(-)
MAPTCLAVMTHPADVHSWTVADLKVCDHSADGLPDSCSLATTSDDCVPVLVPEVAGFQYRRDLLLSFRSLLPVQPPGYSLPKLQSGGRVTEVASSTGAETEGRCHRKDNCSGAPKRGLRIYVDACIKSFPVSGHPLRFSSLQGSSTSTESKHSMRSSRLCVARASLP